VVEQQQFTSQRQCGRCSRPHIHWTCDARLNSPAV
jgi:hypothetical protein